MELLWRFAMFPYCNTYRFLFCFCRCLKQGCNMFFMSCCAYYIYINIDGISRHVMLESLPTHNLGFGAFKFVNLNCTRPVDFFDMKWPFPPGKYFTWRKPETRSKQQNFITNIKF